MAAVFLDLIYIQVLDSVRTVQDQAVVSLDAEITFCAVLAFKVFVNHVAVDHGSGKLGRIRRILCFRINECVPELSETYVSYNCCGYTEDHGDTDNDLSA